MIPRAYRDATEPTPEAVTRLERSFSGRSVRDRLSVLPEPRGRVSLARRRPRREWLLVPALATAALAWLALPRSIDARLDAPTPAIAELTPEVTARYEGAGEVSGTRAAPRIRWEVGTLRLEVEPGTPLVVETDEGTVRVLGTVFTVDRGALGTIVSVERGRVAVSCGPVELGPGDVHTCLPNRPAGLLARARALRARPVEALDAVRRGLAASAAGDPARGELLAFEVELLTPTDPAAAHAAAETYLREGYSARAEEMRTYTRNSP